MVRKRVFKSLEEINEAYKPPDGYESREENKKRQIAMRVSILRWKKDNPTVPDELTGDSGVEAQSTQDIESAASPDDTNKSQSEEEGLYSSIHSLDGLRPSQEAADFIPTLESYLDLLGMRIIRVPGNGACFYYAVYASKLPSMEGDRLLALEHNKGATDMKKRVLGVLIGSLDRWVANGDIRIVLYYQRYFQRALEGNTADGIEQIKAFIRTFRYLDVSQGLPYSAWAGEQEMMAVVLHFREPLFVFDIGVLERFGGGTVDAAFLTVYSIDLRRRDDPSSEFVKIQHVGPQEARSILSTFLMYRVVPLVITLNQRSQHFECLRIDQQLHTEWNQADENCATMRDRLDQALGQSGLYVAPRASPFSIDAPDIPDDEFVSVAANATDGFVREPPSRKRRKGVPTTTQEVTARYATPENEVDQARKKRKKNLNQALLRLQKRRCGDTPAKERAHKAIAKGRKTTTREKKDTSHAMDDVSRTSDGEFVDDDKCGGRSVHPSESKTSALWTHAEGLARLQRRDEARAHIEAEEEEDRAAEAAEKRRVRRAKVRYQHALANHEDFDVSSVSGEKVVAGRHRLPDPSDECPMCHAWKWPGESATACCVDGRVQLPPLLPAPILLRKWFADEEFRRQIRTYNQVFAFTSLGASCSGGFKPVAEDRSVQGQRGTYTYRIQGPMGHFMGSLLPYTHPVTGEEQSPKFAQIYVYDPDMEQRAVTRRGVFDGLNEVALMDLEALMQEFNPFAREFITMGDRMRQLQRDGIDPVNIAFRLRANYEAGRTYNSPVIPEVAAVLVEDGNAANHRDLVLFPQRGGLLRLFETLSIYAPTQYVLLLPFGELGWTYTDEYAGGREYRKKKTMSLREHIAYRLYQKTGDSSVLHLGGRLFQQYVVDQCAKVEQERLRWVAANQREIRADVYKGVRDAYMNEEVLQLGEREAIVSRFDPISGNLEHPDQNRSRHFLDQVGQRVILPASFTGGERYMYEQYQESMAMVREYGKPDLFMTVTCNPQWHEIDHTAKQFGDYFTAQDRPDIVARVWQQKLRAVLKDLDEGVLGYMIARIYVVEFQKRGLPHAHILIILADEDKPKTRQDYDRFVSAEVPDRHKHPDLYSTVMTSMIHGPCGEGHPNSPCMKNGKCSKGFPKALSEVTQTNDNGFPVYRRRQRAAGDHQFKSRVYDNASLNQWVVPYNPYFSQKYDCHINLEICSTITAIKYLYKYVYKGSDKTEISAEAVRRDEAEGPRRREPNEIVRFVKARYISPIEACMRLLEFTIQGKTHSVTTLTVHLPDNQYITFRETDDPVQVVEEPVDTTLTAFFKLAASDDEARHMLYQDIPKRFNGSNTTHPSDFT